MMWQSFAFLLLLSAFGATVGEEVPCMTNTNCTRGTGYSSLSVINNNYYCCANGYSMRWRNNQCSCRGRASAASQSVGCDEGAKCDGVSSFSTINGVTRCCQAGYNIQTSNSYINGRQLSSCTCTRGGFGGGGVQIISSGFSGSTSNSNFDVNAFNQRMNSWSQNFQQSLNSRLRNMTNNLQRRLSNIFRNINV